MVLVIEVKAPGFRWITNTERPVKSGGSAASFHQLVFECVSAVLEGIFRRQAMGMQSALTKFHPAHLMRCLPWY
jgi:hypothetical protein